mgnify:CR=1 FL=1
MNNRTKLNLFFPVVNFAFCFPVSIGFSFSYFFLNTIHVFIIKEEEKNHTIEMAASQPYIHLSFIHLFIRRIAKRKDKTRQVVFFCIERNLKSI